VANEGLKFVGGLCLVAAGIGVLFYIWAFYVPLVFAGSYIILAVILFAIGGYLFYKGAVQEKTIDSR